MAWQTLAASGLPPSSGPADGDETAAVSSLGDELDSLAEGGRRLGRCSGSPGRSGASGVGGWSIGADRRGSSDDENHLGG